MGDGTVRAMRERAQALMGQVIGIAGECMLEHKEEIVALVIDQQQEQHEDSLGNPLRAYSTPYRKHKELAGKTGETDLDETGEMHATMNLSVNGDTYSIDSPATTDQGELKSEWLKAWDNDQPIMDLTEENKKAAWGIIRDDFTERINEVLVLD